MLLFSTLKAWANPKSEPHQMVLLTSFDPRPNVAFPNEIPEWIRSYLEKSANRDLREIPLRLESTFRRFYRHFPQFDLKVIHLATQEDAWRELHDPLNFGVYWISHASGPEASEVLGGNIVDGRGFSVAPIFQDAHHDLRILGILGCGSTERLLDSKPFRHLFDREIFPDLRVTANDDLVDATSALERAMENTRFAFTDSDARLNRLLKNQSWLKRHRRRDHGPTTKVLLTVKRTFLMGSPEFYTPAVRILDSRTGQVFAVMPESTSARPNASLNSNGELEQSVAIELAVPNNFTRANTLDLLIDAGANSHWQEELWDLGNISVESGFKKGSWQILSSPISKQPMGRESHILKFKFFN